MRRARSVRRLVSLAAAAAVAAVATSCGEGDARAEREAAAPPSGPAPRATSGAPVVWLEDATAASGIDFVHDAGTTEEKHLPETMGGGVALLDADGDGGLDAYFVQSGPMPVGPARERGPEVPPNRLYLGAGGGRFVDVTETSGAAAHRGYGMGVAAGDLDGDADPDLLVTGFGPDAVLVNEGRGTFADGTEASGIADERWTAGATLFDADADGDLDAYVTAYVRIDVDDPAWCGDRRPGWRSYCHPDHYDALPDRFWRNDGTGRFVDATAEAGLVPASAGKGLGAIACDLDADADLDLYVANDSTPNELWRNRGDGTFESVTLLSGTGVNRAGATEAGMGLAAADVDGDHDLDLVVTNFDDESNTLYRNDGGWIFTDASVGSGLEAASRMPVGFGVVLEDLDLDGDPDLAVANGHIIDNIELYHDGKRWRQRAQLFVNVGGRFDDAPERAGGLAAVPLVGRGLVPGDLDGDGDPDLVLTECDGPARVLRNVAATRPALVVRGLPYGTLVEGRTASGRRVLRTSGPAVSYLGSGEDAVYLGAGGEAWTGLRVLEPGGRWRDVPLDPPRVSGTVRVPPERSE